MRLRRTSILAAVAALLLNQAAFAAELCLASVNAAACEPACCEHHKPLESLGRQAPATPAQHHPCCDETLPSKAAQFHPGPSAFGLNVNAKETAVADHPASGELLSGSNAISLGRGGAQVTAHIHPNHSLLNLILRC